MVSLGRRLILIAEDNHDLAFSLAWLLKIASFEVIIVHDGNAALAAAKARKPDILLLDIGLPGLNGYQVARAFREDAGLRHILIIATSGYSPGMLPSYSRPGDFDHYFVKPVDFTTLLPLLQ